MNVKNLRHLLATLTVAVLLELGLLEFELGLEIGMNFFMGQHPLSFMPAERPNSKGCLNFRILTLPVPHLPAGRTIRCNQVILVLVPVWRHDLTVLP